jgi:hypothetical protein
MAKITISAGRTFNHPYEQFANFRPGLQLKIVPDEDGEDAIQIIKDLQAKIEGLVEDHKKNKYEKCKCRCLLMKMLIFSGS